MDFVHDQLGAGPKLRVTVVDTFRGSRNRGAKSVAKHVTGISGLVSLAEEGGGLSIAGDHGGEVHRLLRGFHRTVFGLGIGHQAFDHGQCIRIALCRAIALGDISAHVV